MNADLKHENLTDAILCCVYTVYNILGYGFQKKVYENAGQRWITSELRSATGIQKESF